MKCKDCEYWKQIDSDKGTCDHVCKDIVHYHGYVKADDYCAKFSQDRKNKGWRLTHDD